MEGHLKVKLVQISKRYISLIHPVILIHMRYLESLLKVVSGMFDLNIKRYLGYAYWVQSSV